MYKISIITEYSGLGGGETSLLNLVADLKNKAEIDVITMTKGKLNDNLSKINIKNTYIDYKNIIRKGKFNVLLKELEIINKSDAVILNSKSCIYLLPIIKYIKEKNKIIYIEHSNWTKFKFIEKILLKKVYKILCVSKSVERNLKSQGDFKNTLYFPLALDTKDKKYKDIIEKRKIKVAMIGRFQEIKGQELFVDIANEFKNNDKYVFYIVGGKPFGTKEEIMYEKRVLDKINKHNIKNINLLGERNDVDSLLKNNIDILIIPSKNESFGMVALEASKNGVPFITSYHCEGPREIAKNLDITQCVVKNRNSKEFARVIELISDNEIYRSVSYKLYNNIKQYDIKKSSDIIISLVKGE